MAQITGWDSRARLLSRRGKNQPPGKLSACSRDDNTPVHVRARRYDDFARVPPRKNDKREAGAREIARKRDDWYALLNWPDILHETSRVRANGNRVATQANVNKKIRILIRTKISPCSV